MNAWHLCYCFCSIHFQIKMSNLLLTKRFSFSFCFTTIWLNFMQMSFWMSSFEINQKTIETEIMQRINHSHCISMHFHIMIFTEFSKNKTKTLNHFEFPQNFMYWKKQSTKFQLTSVTCQLCGMNWKYTKIPHPHHHTPPSK